MFFVEFEFKDQEAYSRLDAAVNALASAKQKGEFADDEFWKGFFHDVELSRFWWPTARTGHAAGRPRR